jgi:streptogrisin C
MEEMTNLKVMFAALIMLSAFVTSPVSIVHAQEAGDASTPTPEVAPPGIDDAISDAELQDLQTVASQSGLSLQEAIDRYAWNDNFAFAVSEIREASPEAFARAEIVDGDRAWVGFAGDVPQAALDIIDTFRSSHSGVRVEVRTDLGFTEVELQSAIQAVHSAVFEAPEVRDAATSFDFATGQITTTVVLESTASGSVLDDLRTVAAANLTNATRADIVNSITTSVVRSEHQVLGVYESNTEHQEGLVTNSSGSVGLLSGRLGLLIVAAAVTGLLVFVAWLFLGGRVPGAAK